VNDAPSTTQSTTSGNEAPVKAKITQAFLSGQTVFEDCAIVATRLREKRHGKTVTPGSYDVSDADQRGLVLRVRPSGHHSWLVRLGWGKWYTIGRADVIPPLKARKLARECIGEHEAGDDPIEAKRRAKRNAATLGDFLTKQYAPWAAAQWKTGAQTVTRVQAVFADFLPKPLTEITAFSIERWRTARHKAGLAPSTTNRDLGCLGSVLSQAVKWKLLKEHPLKAVTRATLDTIGRVRFLSPAEETRLRTALTARELKLQAGRAAFNAWRTDRGYKTLPDYGTYADHLHPLVLAALLTGARRGELFDLRWGAVDLERAQVTLIGTTTKSGLSRHVPLCTEAQTVLRTWHGQQPAKRQEPEALVFPSPQTSERLDNISTAWGGLMKAATLKDFTFHSLRHSFASTLAQRGVDLFVIQRLLGHASPIMTQRYSHLADEHLTAAVAKLG
jgi:integrase